MENSLTHPHVGREALLFAVDRFKSDTEGNELVSQFLGRRLLNQDQSQTDEDGTQGVEGGSSKTSQAAPIQT